MVDIPQPASGPAGTKGKVEDPTKQALFSLCGIYMLYWVWLRLGELNTYLGKEVVKPMFFFIGIICCPVMLYVLWLMVNALHEAKQKAGGEVKDEKVMDMVWFLLCGPVGVYMMQQKLNAIWQK